MTTRICKNKKCKHRQELNPERTNTVNWACSHCGVRNKLKKPIVALIAILVAVGFSSAYAIGEPGGMDGFVLIDFDFDGVSKITFSDEYEIMRAGGDCNYQQQGREWVLYCSFPFLLPLGHDQQPSEPEIRIWNPIKDTYQVVPPVEDGFHFVNPRLPEPIVELIEDVEPEVEPPIERSILERTFQVSPEIEQCLRGDGPYAAFQEKSAFNIESLDFTDLELEVMRDNLENSPAAAKILKAIEECRIMVTYHDTRALIGDYEENRYLADIAGVDQHNRTGHPALDPAIQKEMNVQGGNATFEEQRALDTIAEKPWRAIESGFNYTQDAKPEFSLSAGYGEYLRLKTQSSPEVAVEIIKAHAEVCSTYFKGTINEVYADEERYDSIPQWMRYCVPQLAQDDLVVCFKGREQVEC